MDGNRSAFVYVKN